MIRKQSFALSAALHVSVIAGVFLYISHLKKSVEPKLPKPTLIKLAMLQNANPLKSAEPTQEVPKKKEEKTTQKQAAPAQKPILTPKAPAKAATTQTSSVAPIQPAQTADVKKQTIEKRQAKTQQTSEQKSEQKVVQKPQPQAPTVDIKGIQNAYLRSIHQSASKQKTYPKNAKRLGQEGVAYVHFVILSDGSVTNISLQKSSGFALLDEAALKLIASLKDLKPIPKELAKERYDILLPIDYKLE